VIALVVVWILALLGRYSAERHSGVRNTALYWHYLTVVWLVLFGLLLAGG
jgi:cytochrome c oxidase subunit 3